MLMETNDPAASVTWTAADYAAASRQLVDHISTNEMRVIACQRTDPRSVSQAGGGPASAKALSKREKRQTE